MTRNSSDFNRQIDRTFIKLKKTLRDLEEKMDEFEVGHSPRRSLKSAKKVQKQGGVGSKAPSDQVSKKLPMTTQSGAEIDLLDLDFEVSPPKASETNQLVDFQPTVQQIEVPVPVSQAQQPAPFVNPLDLLDIDAANAKLLQPPAPEPRRPEQQSTDFFDQIALRNDLF